MRSHAEATRDGRVRLRPNRGFPYHPALQRDPPHEILVSWPANFIRDDVICEATLEAPAQAELSPYLRRGFSYHPALRRDPT